jgi:hypothetical protein
MCIEKAQARAVELKELNRSDEVSCLAVNTGVSAMVILGCAGFVEAPPVFFGCLGIAIPGGAALVTQCTAKRRNDDRRVEIDLGKDTDDCQQ